MAADQRNLGDRISDAVTDFGGSWRFIIIFSTILVVWVAINSLLPFLAWDKPPFILLNLLLSFIAAFQAPFIMMTQNRSEKKQDEAYRQLFYEIKELIQTDIESSAANEKDLHEIKAELKMMRQIKEKKS